ncbi:hypothetical protein DIPPA_58720 [Diplonema papillatum]|nr:hypothetical protein DIPPA_58720 [Diplonema papillatum]
MSRLAFCLLAMGLLGAHAQKNEGLACLKDSDCKGYCHKLMCFNGSSGDPCGFDSDCQSGLTCYGIRPFSQCTAGKPEGAVCVSDSDCLGYCEKLRCRDGSSGDLCGSNSDCQSGNCKRKCKICMKKCA